ncbi:MAG: T9SS type A sorting domain-containing protein [Bacteroidota bacterium]
MKYSFLLLALLGIQFLAAQPKPILAAEYFFDNVDPGYGNATPIPVPNPAEFLDLVFDVPTAGLTPGMHQIDIRVKRDSAWSGAHRRFFFVKDLGRDTTDAPAIVAVEYFFGDVDPGFGQGQLLPVSQPGTQIDLIGQLNLSGFSPGFHLISFRAQNAQQVWSETLRRFFFIPDTVSTYRLDRLSYEVQQNGTTLSTGTVPISPQQYAVSLQFDVSTAGLAPGFYDLCVIAVDEANRESAAACRVFQVSGGSTAIDAASTTDLRIFPSPTAGPLRIQADHRPILSYLLSDASGRVLKRAILSGASVHADLDLSALPAGTYYLAVEQAGTVRVSAVVKR